MRLIKAKFDSKCKDCNGSIKTGDSIFWERGEGVKHEKCPPLTECKNEEEKQDFFEKKEIKKRKWKDPRRYKTLKTLRKKDKCQCCGTKLYDVGDSFIDDDRRVCEECWGVQ